MTIFYISTNFKSIICKFHFKSLLLSTDTAVHCDYICLISPNDEKAKKVADCLWKVVDGQLYSLVPVAFKLTYFLL